MRLLSNKANDNASSRTSSTSTVACPLSLFSSFLLFAFLFSTATQASVIQARTPQPTELDSAMPPPIFRRSIKNEFLHRFRSLFGIADGDPKPIDPAKHTVWLNDNTAWRADGKPDGAWTAEFVAAYFAKDSGEDASEFIAAISDLIGLADDAAERATVAERVQPFADAILPGSTVNVNFGGKGQLRLGPANDQGISSNALRLPAGSYSNGQLVEFQPVKGESETGPGQTVFAEPTGWLVISDIDDTIKVSKTYDVGGLIEKTFVAEPEPVRGMPELFTSLTQTLSNPAYFYLTASPYNLYRFLSGFRKQFFPPGTMILRDSSWMNIAGFLATLTQGTQSYKVDRIEKIHRWLPRRSVICIGDSTQKDPEAYAEAYRKHPDWIRAIYIRKVEGGKAMEDKNKDERFVEAFRGVPESVWQTFVEPEELNPLIEALAN